MYDVVTEKIAASFCHNGFAAKTMLIISQLNSYLGQGWFEK